MIKFGLLDTKRKYCRTWLKACKKRTWPPWHVLDPILRSDAMCTYPNRVDEVDPAAFGEYEIDMVSVIW